MKKLTADQIAAMRQLPINNAVDYPGIDETVLPGLEKRGLVILDPIGTWHRTPAGNTALENV